MKIQPTRVIQLTHIESGLPVYVNPKKIRFFDEKPTGTRIVFSESNAIVVKETVPQILAAPGEYV